MARRILRMTGTVLSALILIAGGILFYILHALPNLGPAPDIKIEATLKRLERGKYLANCQSGCLDCHSLRDESRYAAPVIEGSLGKGGMVFPTDAGKVIAPNITPFALGNWTDGEIYRAITSGVNKEGKPLFPLMPYENFGKMDIEDIYSIIAYIRTLKPIANTPERTDLKFPLNIIVHTMPSKGEPEKMPDPGDSVNYSEYIIEASNCKDCHSPMKDGKRIPEMDYSGGMEFRLANGGLIRSANITPDRQTGIGSWSREMFIARFKSSLDSGYTHPIKRGERQTVMPWTYFANMKEQDLSAIYSYLRTVKPVNKVVKTFENK